jgi:hypothetical protein
VLANSPARVRLAVLGATAFLLLCSTGILTTLTPAAAATSHKASLGAHGTSTWTVGRSVYVNLKAMTPGTWKQELWSNTCASPIARLAVLPSLVVPTTRTLKKTTRATAVPSTRLGVSLRLVHGSSTVCGVFITSPRAKYEGDCQYCFVGGEGPLAPVWDPATNGSTYRPGDRREIVYLDENYQVPAGTTATFDNKIIIVKPVQRKNIQVFGTLTITNSLMIWRQTDSQQTRLAIEKGGTLIIKDSYSFSGNPYWVNWDYNDGSTVRFDHFIGDPWTSIRGSVDYTAINYSTVRISFLSDTHATHVQVSNAHHVWFEIFPPEGTYTFTLPAKRQWADWTISDLWPSTAISVHDSYVYERDISLQLPNTHVTVQDTPSGFGFGWAMYKDSPGYVDCELRNVGQPGTTNENGKYYEEVTWDLPCMNASLTVRNARLEKTWGYIWGFVHLKVYGSNLADTGVYAAIGNSYGPIATEEIYQSTIDEIFDNGGGLIYVQNSRVSDLISVRDVGSVVYGYGVTGPYKVLKTGGGAYVPLDRPGPPW